MWCQIRECLFGPAEEKNGKNMSPKGAKPGKVLTGRGKHQGQGVIIVQKEMYSTVIEGSVKKKLVYSNCSEKISENYFRKNIF